MEKLFKVEQWDIETIKARQREDQRMIILGVISYVDARRDTFLTLLFTPILNKNIKELHPLEQIQVSFSQVEDEEDQEKQLEISTKIIKELMLVKGMEMRVMAKKAIC